MSCGIVVAVSEASNQKSQNGPSTQLIKERICLDRSNAKIKAKELSYFSSYQILTTNKNWRSYQPAKKLLERLTVRIINSC
jgi:hypothetical protein